MNSAAAIVAYDLSQGVGDPDADVHDALAAGLERAAAAIDAGKSAALLDRWSKLTNTLGDS